MNSHWQWATPSPDCCYATTACSNDTISCDFMVEGSSSDMECMSRQVTAASTVPSHQLHLLPLAEGADWLSSAALPRPMEPHWLFTAAWADTGGAAGDSSSAGRDSSTDDWRIGTSSVAVQDFLAPTDITSERLACSVHTGPLADDCSDPLVATAQELVAAAAASATPGVHAPRADSAALLNSGAVLLLGQGSTTICGTNTTPVAAVLSPQEGCGEQPCVLSPAQDTPPAQQRPQQQSQQQQQRHHHQQPAGRAVRAGAIRAGARRAGRRRQGLLLDSQAGMQLLVGGAAADPHPVACGPPEKPAAQPGCLQDARYGHPPPPPPQQQGLAGQPGSRLGQGPLSHDQHVPADLQRLSARSNACQGDIQSVPASGEVLVLGGDASAGTVDALTASAGGAAASAAAAAAAGLGEAGGPHASAGAAPAPLLQLLSCSSLNSIAPACRSNSSLIQLNLSNCSFLRLGSASTQTSSFTSHDGSLVQSRQGSFTGQRQGSFTAPRQGSFTGQHPGAAALLSPGSVAGLPGAAPASRPSPLPMLHESRSWGAGLNTAARQAAAQQQQQQQQQQPQQQEAAAVRRQHAGAAAAPLLQQQQLNRQQEQLYYLLD